MIDSLTLSSNIYSTKFAINALVERVHFCFSLEKCERSVGGTSLKLKLGPASAKQHLSSSRLFRNQD